MNDMSRADVTLSTPSGAEPLDLTAELQIIALMASPGCAQPSERVLFTGHALRSRPEPGHLNVLAESGRELVESSVGFLQHEGVPAFELIHFMARRSGLPEERINIQGLDEAVAETFTIEQPVQGLHVSRVVVGPEVTILPLDTDAPTGPLLAMLPDIAAKWGQPTAIVRTTVTARVLFEALELGVARIGVALDVLLATAVYGLSEDPWGRELSFDREGLRSRPTVIPVVAATGLATGKRITTSTEGQALETKLDVDAAFERWSDILNGRPSDEVARALRALRDAADESRDVFDRCHALSTALEHYSSKSRPPKVVSQEARQAAIAALSTVKATDAEMKRLSDLINAANNPPLMAKVRHQIEADKVPVSADEWDVITTLRSVRNRTVHGHAPSIGLPDGNRLRWGVSITARLILFRWAAEKPAN